MDNIQEQKPEGKKTAVIGWLLVLAAGGILAYLVWRSFSAQTAINKQMAKVRSFREVKEDKPATDV